jgi:hypothetical protein
VRAGAGVRAKAGWGAGWAVGLWALGCGCGLVGAGSLCSVWRVAACVCGRLYLCDAGVEFEGGAFSFHDPDADRTVLPRSGSLLLFSSGAENPHSVARVTRGVRFALAAWFTHDARHRADVPQPTAGGAGTCVPWALGGGEAALLSAATHSLAGNDPLRLRLLEAHARGASLHGEMRAMAREAARGGEGDEAVCDPSAVTSWFERTAAGMAAAATADGQPAREAHCPPGAAGALLEALRKAVHSKAAVCSQLLSLRDAASQGAPHQEASAAADPFDVFD